MFPKSTPTRFADASLSHRFATRSINRVGAGAVWSGVGMLASPLAALIANSYHFTLGAPQLFANLSLDLIKLLLYNRSMDIFTALAEPTM